VSQSSQCPDCGENVDEDTGACETCLARFVAAEEELDRDLELDPALEERLELMVEFLRSDSDRAGMACPECLQDFVAGTQTCNGCSGELVGWARAREMVRGIFIELRGTCFVPVLSEQEPELFGVLLEILEGLNESGAFDFRVKEDWANFSAIFGHHQGFSRTLVLRFRELPRLEAFMVEHRERLGALPGAQEMSSRIRSLLEQGSAVS